VSTRDKGTVFYFYGKFEATHSLDFRNNNIFFSKTGKKKKQLYFFFPRKSLHATHSTFLEELKEKIEG